MKIYKNQYGYYIIEGIGCIIYLPDEMIDFCNDYLDGIEKFVK